MSRDPIGEQGSKNIYLSFKNDPPNSTDFLGLQVQLLDGRNDFTRAEYDRLTKECGIPQTEDRKALLNYGCIGVCMAAQGQNSKAPTYPERYADTKCYLTEIEARKRDCKDCKRKVTFSKQGAWKNGKAPVQSPDGSVPNDSVTSTDPNRPGLFNNVTIGQLKGKEWYIWADHAEPGMHVTVDRVPCNDEHYPSRIWCTTCIK